MKRIYRPHCLPSPQPRIISLVREVSFDHARNRESIPMRAINRKKSTRDSLSVRVLLSLRYLPPLIFARLAKSTEVVIISERFGVAEITIFTLQFFSISRFFFLLANVNRNGERKRNIKELSSGLQRRFRRTGRYGAFARNWKRSRNRSPKITDRRSLVSIPFRTVVFSVTL